MLCVCMCVRVNFLLYLQVFLWLFIVASFYCSYPLKFNKINTFKALLKQVAMGLFNFSYRCMLSILAWNIPVMIIIVYVCVCICIRFKVQRLSQLRNESPINNITTTTIYTIYIYNTSTNNDDNNCILRYHSPAGELISMSRVHSRLAHALTQTIRHVRLNDNYNWFWLLSRWSYFLFNVEHSTQLRFTNC